MSKLSGVQPESSSSSTHNRKCWHGVKKGELITSKSQQAMLASRHGLKNKAAHQQQIPTVNFLACYVFLSQQFYKVCCKIHKNVQNVDL
jgi:hypothetical protein